tara:strand:+ start:602 stop:976 length:375 start_codon:yes stop_codon:yes gene_type:complete
LAVLPIKFSNLFSVESGERLGGLYQNALAVKPFANALGVILIVCPDKTKGCFSVERENLEQCFCFHFHHETMIAQGVGQRLSHRFELHKKLFSLFSHFRLDFLPGCPAACQEKTFNNRRFFVTY